MFNDLFRKYSWEYVHNRIYNSTEQDLKRVLNSTIKNIEDFYPLFSPAADLYLEKMAQLSLEITRSRFGNTIQLYTPLYISNECSNSCLYCGFNTKNEIRRITLNIDQIKAEAEEIYKMGFRHILLLTGENRKAVPVKMLSEIGKEIHKDFASITIEVYPMDSEEYSFLIDSGIDGLTLYQETYNKTIYEEVHPSGRKKDFFYRIDGPDRGGSAGFRKIGIGALLGLSDWRVDGFFTALHGYYLTKKYWESHIQVSFPRLRDAAGEFDPLVKVSDKNLTHLICAMRIILNDAGLVLSTRESSYFRDNVMALGITMMSAGSKTEPGGHTDLNIADNQFNIEDTRSPQEIIRIIKQKGLDPVWKDWDKSFIN